MDGRPATAEWAKLEQADRQKEREVWTRQLKLGCVPNANSYCQSPIFTNGRATKAGITRTVNDVRIATRLGGRRRTGKKLPKYNVVVTSVILKSFGYALGFGRRIILKRYGL